MPPRSHEPPRTVSALLAASLLLMSRLASADSVAADAHFEEGRQLLAQGRYPEACERFEASQREEPAGGTLLHLALCRELEGKTATAWRLFREAGALARSQGRADREKIAQDHMSALDSKLSRLIIVVGPDSGNLRGLTVKRDDAEVRREQWGVSVPLDPGPHLVTATAEGKKSWQQSIDIQFAVPITIVTISGLEDAGGPAPPAPKPPEPRSPIDLRTRFGLEAGLSLSASREKAGAGMGPRWSGTLAAQAGLRLHDLSIALEGRWAPPVATTGESASIDVSTLLFTLVPCGHQDVFYACLTGSLGAFSVEAGGVSGTGVFAGGGPRIGLEIPLAERFKGQIHLDFTIQSPVTLVSEGAPVWESSRYAGALGAGVLGVL